MRTGVRHSNRQLLARAFQLRRKCATKRNLAAYSYVTLRERYSISFYGSFKPFLRVLSMDWLQTSADEGREPAYTVLLVVGWQLESICQDSERITKSFYVFRHKRSACTRMEISASGMEISTLDDMQQPSRLLQYQIWPDHGQI